ncbi:MAG: hypothetical protein K0S58_3582, partial [Nitrospira sp.]|nr:hypothetical protein [Nitrospira sp.]
NGIRFLRAATTMAHDRLSGCPTRARLVGFGASVNARLMHPSIHSVLRPLK